jgi:hypothetical protein
MARMSDSSAVAANTTTANILAGKLHEFLNENSVVRLLATSSATGINATLLVGGESVCQDQIVSFANRFPIFPDDMVVEAGGFAGDRLVLFYRNTTGGSLTANTAVDVLPA